MTQSALLELPAALPSLAGRPHPGWTIPPSDSILPEDRTRHMAMTTGKAARQKIRIAEAQQIARAILHGRCMEIHSTREDGAYMVDTLTGEVVEGLAGDSRRERHAALMMLASEKGNHYAGLQWPDDSEPYELGGVAFAPSVRLDPNWLEQMRRRSRKEAREGLKRAEAALPTTQKIMKKMGWRGRFDWSFLTLTMPRITGARSLEEIARINRAWTLFRKRKEFEKKVFAGVKAIENKLTMMGPHVHLHALILAKYWPHPLLKELWRECLDLATREMHGFGIAEDSELIVDIRMVKNRRQGPRSIGSHELGEHDGNGGAMSLDEALEECCKYVTKPDDYASLPPDTLYELLEVSRWPRMFELLGAARAPRTPKKPLPALLEPLPELDREAGQGSLDTTCISDGGGKGLQGQLFVEWSDTLQTATFPASAPGAFDPEDDPPKGRPPSWRQLMDILPFGAWLTLMVERAGRARHFRARQLCAKYPNATLFALTGESLGAL